MHLTKSGMETMDRRQRLNIINSITGIKPANLIGTKSEEHGSNLAIFNSIVHLGSNPGFIGLILRPIGEVPRHSYENMKANDGYYTINHIHNHFIKQAHYTSAKVEKGTSEFDVCKLTEEYLFDFPAPFVGESQVKLGMRLVEEIPIKSNGTILLVGSIEHLIVPDESVNEKGYIDLEQLNIVGIGGLNCYYDLTKIGEFPYVRLSEMPEL